ncbi:MAG: hypothetical protein Tp1123DCM1511741_13 [Prokaryotic dsDNA virus sp.]|nr:MAG: hypothetical protein Tp1123DCM1511741_13 [Prokaryotic dsDNA virus sp.]|tara:strand:+ start:25742 stop:26032 length:291 start_codon:yes stop_codon:yes gene_type:complete
MTKKEKKHMRQVAQIGCIICRKLGYEDTPAELHHINNGIMGKRATNFEVIPLCPYHHRTSNEAYHYNTKLFTEKWGTQENLLEETLRLLYDKNPYQ